MLFCDDCGKALNPNDDSIYYGQGAYCADHHPDPEGEEGVCGECGNHIDRWQAGDPISDLAMTLLTTAPVELEETFTRLKEQHGAKTMLKVDRYCDGLAGNAAQLGEYIFKRHLDQGHGRAIGAGKDVRVKVREIMGYTSH